MKSLKLSNNLIMMHLLMHQIAVDSYQRLSQKKWIIKFFIFYFKTLRTRKLFIFFFKFILFEFFKNLKKLFLERNKGNEINYSVNHKSRKKEVRQ